MSIVALRSAFGGPGSLNSSHYAGRPGREPKSQSDFKDDSTFKAVLDVGGRLIAAGEVNAASDAFRSVFDSEYSGTARQSLRSTEGTEAYTQASAAMKDLASLATSLRTLDDQYGGKDSKHLAGLLVGPLREAQTVSDLYYPWYKLTLRRLITRIS